MTLALVQPVKAVTDDCYSGVRWTGALYNEKDDSWIDYLPIDFFGSDGASIPGYVDTISTIHPYFFMNDTTCSSNDWSIRFSGISSVGNWGESLAVVGIDIIGYTPTPSLKASKPRNKPLHIEIKDTIRKRKFNVPGLKSYTAPYVMGFDYHDDTLYFYRNGYFYRKEAFHVCKLVNPCAYWEKMGGTLTNLDYWDKENGTEYHEDFSDCANVQEFPECEPEPVITLEAYFELPNCQDSTLRLHANSNILEELHWEGPEGFEADGTDLVIDYEDAKSGTYLVWGKTDPCHEAAYQLLDIKIPELKKDTNYVVSSCHGDTIRVGNKIYTENGIYYDTLKTAEGCDSIVVTIYNFYYRHHEYNDSICAGGSYLFNGKYLTEPGTYIDTVKVPECNCDSIVTLNLSTFQITGEKAETLCKGKTYNLGDLAIDKSGTYTQMIKTDGGCDSLATLNISFYQKEESHNETICEGSSYDFHGEPLTEKGVYKTTYIDEEGCEVAETLVLETYAITEEVKATICSGQTYTFNGKIYKKSGSYSDTLKTKDGCDSIVTLHLRVQGIKSPTVVNLTICKGDTLSYEGHTFTHAGNVRDTLSNQFGCDSLVVYKVQETKLRDTAFVYNICTNEPVQVITGEWINRDTTYTTAIKFDNYECKMNTHITVKSYPPITLEDTTINLCGKHSTRVVLDSLKYLHYQWLPTEGVSSPNSRNTMVSFAGDSVNYKVALTNTHCYDTINVKLTYSPAPTITNALVEADGNNLLIEVEGGTPPYFYQIDTTGDWHNSVDFEDLAIGAHGAYIIDSKGCQAFKPFHYFIPVIPAKYMTPNGDGVRDTWEIKNLEYYDIYTIEIFDRWGKSLITYKNEYPGWDGTYNGNKMPSTDYWYVISVDLNEQEITGHFTLLRK